MELQELTLPQKEVYIDFLFRSFFLLNTLLKKRSAKYN